MNWIEIIFCWVSIFLGIGIVSSVMYALVENWKNYARSQRLYMAAGLMIGATAVQRGSYLLTHNMQPNFIFWMTLVTLFIIVAGVACGRDTRLREKPWEQSMREQEGEAEFAVYMKLVEMTRQTNDLLKEDKE